MGPLAAIAGPLIGGIASAGASALIGGITGTNKSSNLANSTLSNINAGGLTSTVSGKGDKRTINIGSNPLRSGLVGQLAKTFPEQARLLNQLRLSVAPGVSGLRASRLRSIENARTAALGDLRENLARRRVAGSSFAQDAITRANISFAEEKDRVEAESFMQELELTSQIAQAEFDAARGEFTTQLDELNFQAETATALAGAMTTQMGANARLQAELDAKNAAGAGAFFQPAIDGIGKAVSGMFTPGAPVVSTSGAGFY